MLAYRIGEFLFAPGLEFLNLPATRFNGCFDSPSNSIDIALIELWVNDENGLVLQIHLPSDEWPHTFIYGAEIDNIISHRGTFINRFSVHTNSVGAPIFLAPSGNSWYAFWCAADAFHDAYAGVDMSENPIINTHNLSKWYGQVIGVNDVTLSIGAGVTGLLGPNGAGKSTLLRLMTGQLKPSKGTLTVLGEPVWNNPALNRRIGYCPDQDTFYEFMTGFEFVRFLTMLNGYSSDEAAQLAVAAIDTVSMTEAKDKTIGAYSKGMRQRIKLAQALVHRPTLLFLDEPLTGMDAIGRRQTIRLIKELGERGVNVIVSSHILHEIEAMTNKIVLMQNGRILAEGHISDIRALIDKHPHNVYLRCNKPRLMASICAGFDDVASVKIEAQGESVVIETRKPDAFYSRLPGLVMEHNIDIEQLYSPDDNLQAVFKYLVE